MERIMYIVIFFILLQVSAIFGNDNTKPKGPPSIPLPDVIKDCKDDAEFFCKMENIMGVESILYCLHGHQSELSEKCKAIIGTTTIGGCQDDAARYCADKLKATEISNCLDDHRDSLTSICLTNIDNRRNGTSPTTKIRSIKKTAIRAMSALSFLYILVPCLIAAWAFYMGWKFSVDQSIFLKDMEILGRFEAIQNDSLDQSKNYKPWELSFFELSYWIPERKPLLSLKSKNDPTLKQILCKTTGLFPSSSLTAIMGPSGCGKTTLLKLLAGQMDGGIISGTRCINGRQLVTSAYDNIMRRQGYVPQNEVLYDSLTVWQTLCFYALLRLPGHWTIRQKLERALTVLVEMALQNVAHNVVHGSGSGTGARDISGGQRRRLSIGIQLLHSPRVLLLDEPTSGLDASTSLRIISILQRSSRGGSARDRGRRGENGSCIVLTIHQPRSEVFDMFDNLLLLGQGGRMVYSGPAAGVMSFLSSCPSICPRRGGPGNGFENPGDFIIDILGLVDDEEEVTEPYDNSEMSTNSTAVDSPPSTTTTSTSLSPRRRQNTMNTLVSHFLTSNEYLSLAETISNQSDTNDLMNRNHLHYRTRKIKNSFLPHNSSSNNSSSKRKGWETTVNIQLLWNKIMGKIFRSNSEYSALPSDNTDGVPREEEEEVAMKDYSVHEMSTEIVDTDDEETKEMPASHNTVTTYNNKNKHITGINEVAADGFVSIDINFDSEVVVDNDIDINGVDEDDDVRHVDAMTENGRDKAAATFLIDGSDLIDTEDYLSFSAQVWILYNRRLQVYMPSLKSIILSYFEMSFVAAILAVAFSYQTDTKLEVPYQVIMLIFMLSSYAMVIQYLSLIPEYICDRKILLMDRCSRCYSLSAYILSAVLIEVPRSIAQCLIIIGTTFLIHPLNPDFTNVTFMIVCLIVGVCAWQSMICLCTAFSDDGQFAYTSVFMLFGAGTLFGGLLVRINKVPLVFSFIHLISPSAITLRALLANDIQCCYLSTTCNELAYDLLTKRNGPSGGDGDGDSNNPSPPPGPSMLDLERQFQEKMDFFGIFNSTTDLLSSRSYCPPGIEFTGDGSDEGNLGRLAEKVIGLDRVDPFSSLLLLFWVNIICRLLAVQIFSYREKRRHQLIHLVGSHDSTSSSSTTTTTTKEIDMERYTDNKVRKSNEMDGPQHKQFHRNKKVNDSKNFDIEMMSLPKTKDEELELPIKDKDEKRQVDKSGGGL